MPLRVAVAVRDDETEGLNPSHVCCRADSATRSIQIDESGARTTLRFSATHGPEVPTPDIFTDLVQPLVAQVLRGQPASLLVFGSPRSGRANLLEGLRRKNGFALLHRHHCTTEPTFACSMLLLALRAMFRAVGASADLRMSCAAVVGDRLIDALEQVGHRLLELCG
jgi:hypothetical protein